MKADSAKKSMLESFGDATESELELALPSAQLAHLLLALETKRRWEALK